MNFIFIYITCKDREEAIKIGKELVESKLAGCVNIFPSMTSIYNWKENIEVADESVLIVKTKESLFKEICDLVSKIHSYTTPCILSFPIQNGNEEYLQWLSSNMK
ncbi:MAG TPA: divalent-cation tolerance protein CutA [Leptospiraceae bacterium]|nr:divalent-cation tolerance protein CutA [Leptospiraceae bacterium]HMW04544.1 divalent-cation tolerance protein CutA [Leptospiraceae bacterium]HMX34341.1 divalent-cation tolerance protein CutA [Leptospiraceae bacterium]HMY30730.1 divalent-cation tolerance protein CutA [Leptospiraceae bacterium]HMZ64308.1 divalent-cation tolerance protein CutA [Leptospiraceae bacterium]